MEVLLILLLFAGVGYAVYKFVKAKNERLELPPEPVVIPEPKPVRKVEPKPIQVPIQPAVISIYKYHAAGNRKNCPFCEGENNSAAVVCEICGMEITGK